MRRPRAAHAVGRRPDRCPPAPAGSRADGPDGAHDRPGPGHQPRPVASGHARATDPRRPHRRTPAPDAHPARTAATDSAADPRAVDRDLAPPPGGRAGSARRSARDHAAATPAAGSTTRVRDGIARPAPPTAAPALAPASDRAPAAAVPAPGHRRARPRGDAGARGAGAARPLRASRAEPGARASRPAATIAPARRPGYGPAAAPGCRRDAARRGGWHPAPRERGAGSRGGDGTGTAGARRDEPRPRGRLRAGSAPGTDELPPLPRDLARDAGAAGADPVHGRGEPGRPRPTSPAADAADGRRSPRRPARCGRRRPRSPRPTAPAPLATPPAAPAVRLRPGDRTSSAPRPDDAPAGSRPDPAVAPAPRPDPDPGADRPRRAGRHRRGAADPGPAAGRPRRAAPDGRCPGPGRRPAPAPEAAAAGDPAPAPTRRSAEANFFLPPRVTPPTRLRPYEERRVTEIMARQEREDVIRNQLQARPQPRPDGTPPARPARRTSRPRPSTTSAAPPARPRPGPSRRSPSPRTGSRSPPATGAPSASTGPPRPPATSRSTSRTPPSSATGIPSSSSSGPIGRYLSYPVDDPNQSTQRNQILQPFFSAGLIALQIAAWPYNGIMDPPWEAQYDLGYYRPGDMVPTDIYWLPLHGYGPPLRGNSY